MSLSPFSRQGIKDSEKLHNLSKGLELLYVNVEIRTQITLQSPVFTPGHDASSHPRDEGCEKIHEYYC